MEYKLEKLSDDVTLYCGDCLEVMAEMEAGSVDSVITDPPYGIGENRARVLSRGGFSTEKWKHALPIDYGVFDWDNRPATAEQIGEIRRVSKHQVIFGGNYFELPPSSSWIVWDKLTTGDFSDCELAWTSHKRAVRKFTYLWSGFRKQMPEKRYHPTQKPLALMKWVIENYTDEGTTILDPFMGSGTTLVAAVQLGRKAIGIEIDETYYEIAKKRIQQAMLQMRLGI